MYFLFLIGFAKHMTPIQEIITGLLCLVVYVALRKLTLRSLRNDWCPRFANFQKTNKSRNTFHFILSPTQSNGQSPRLLQKVTSFFSSATSFSQSFCKSNQGKVVHPAFIGQEGSKTRPGFFDFNPDLLLRLIWNPRFLMGAFILISFAGAVSGATINSTAVGGNWSNPSTWVGGVVPAAGDEVTIADGATVTIDSDTPAIGSLTIGQLSAGILQYETGTGRTMTITGIVTVKKGSVFRSAPSGSTSTITTHSLVVGGSIVNNGTIDFSATAGAGGTTANASGAGITFTGAKNATFDCSSARLTNLRQTNGVILNKGTSVTSVLSFTPGNTFQVLSDGTTNAKGFLSIMNGTFNIIGSNTFSNPVFNKDGSYTIPATGGFWLGNQNATVTGMNGTVTNHGELKITNGTYQVGISGGNSNGIQSNGQFIMSGGSMNISGKFDVENGECRISAGKINIVNKAGDAAPEPDFTVAPQASLLIYGDPLITIEIPNSNNESVNDIQILEGTGSKSITGGTFLLGAAGTPSGSTFYVNSDIPFNKIAVYNECILRIIDTSKEQFKSKLNGTFPQLGSENGGMALTAPENKTIKCNDPIPQSYTSLQAFINDGGKALINCTLLPASFKFVGQNQNNASCPYTLTRTYQVSDIFGNTGTVEHRIFVESEAVEAQPEAVIEPAKEEVLILKSAKAVYTATQNGNWNDPATWGNSGPPTALDDVIIPNTITVTVNAASACTNIDIQAGGTINYSGANTLQVNGNWTNNGTYNGGTNGIVEFAGASNTSISGTTNFEELIINKGSLNTTLTISGPTTVTSGGSLTLTSGLVTIPAGGSFTVNPASALSIPAIAGFDVNGGTLTTGNFTITNEGLIRVSSGTANFGNSSGNSVHTQQDGVFQVSQVSGTSVVNIAGRLENTAGGTLAPLGIPAGINISGGTVTLATQGNGLDNIGSLNVTTNGAFNFTGGKIVFQRESTAGPAVDLGLVSGSGNGAKTTIGGTFQFGNALTPVGTVFNISSGIPLNKVTSFPNTDLKLIGDLTIGDWTLDPGTTIDLNGNSILLSASATGTFTFPLDNGAGIPIPVTINLTSGTFGANPTIEVETLGTKLTENKSSVNYLNRNWTINTNDITNPVYDVTATYAAPTDIAGSETEIAIGNWTGALPWIKGNVVNDVANTVSKTGITATSFVFTGITFDPPTVVIDNGASATICTGTSITLNTTATGDPTFTFSWTSSPAGFTSTLEEPSVSPLVLTDYIVTVTDGNGFTATDLITITVTPNNTVGAASSTPTLCINTALTAITHATTGATGIGAATGLPAGVTAAWAGNVITISGTPTASGAFNYSIPLTGGCGAINATGTITVTPNNTSGAASSTPTLCVNTALTAITHATTGATGIGAATGLPSGVTASWAGNVITISGTPTASGTFNYSIPLTGGCGSVNATGTITVNPLPTITLGALALNCPGAASFLLPYTATTGTPTTYSISAGTPALSGFTPVVNAALTATPLTISLPANVLAGTYQFVITVRNGSGCVSSSQTFNVDFADNTPPVISGCPSNINTTTGAGRTTCDQVASWTEPTATDNCTVSGSLVWTKSHTSGNAFPLGTTTVTYTVKDLANNTATCTFTVTVVDNTPPTFTAPNNITIYSDNSCNYSAPVLLTGQPNNENDNCPLGGIKATFSDGPRTYGACVGTSTVVRTWSLTDVNSNTTTHAQTITIADNIKPVLTLPLPITIECTASTAPANTGQATATDNCGGTVTVTYSDVSVAGNCAGRSTITRTWTATDCSGNSASGNQTISIQDTQAPTLVCTNFTVATPNNIPASDLYSHLAAVDNCGGTVEFVLTDESYTGLTSGAGFCPTSVIRKYIARDQCGNTSAECTQTITVTNTSGCTVCQSNVPFYPAILDGAPDSLWISPEHIREGVCCGVVAEPPKPPRCTSFNVYLDKNAVGLIFDIASGAEPPGALYYQVDCSDPIPIGEVICLAGGRFYTVTFCKPGNNKNTYSIQSISGITGAGGITTRQDAQCADTLTVTGVNPGSVTWTVKSPNDQTLLRYLSSTTSMAPIFTPDQFTPPVIIYEVCGTISGTAECNGNPMTDCNDVTVTTLPAIIIAFDIDLGDICANNIPTINAGVTPINLNYEYKWYAGSNGTGVLLSSIASWKPTVEGDYSLVVTETTSGILCNTATYNFTIAFDVLGPNSIVAPAPLVVECSDPGAAQLIVNWLAAATASDGAVSIPVTNNYAGVTMACNQPPVTVTFTAVDQCGNPSTATSTITVVDTQVPTWTTAAGNLDRSVSCSDAAGLATAQGLAPVAVDVCDPTLTLTKTSGAFVPGACPQTGSYTNTWTATDDCNNISAIYTQVITVSDTQAPTWTTVAGALNQSLSCSDAAGLTAAQALAPVAADLCDATLTLTKTAGVFVVGTCPQAGSYTNTWTATDDCGNISTVFTQVITITDTQAPVITCPAAASGTTATNECFSLNVVLGTATATDNCSTAGQITITNNAPAQFPLGITTVIWTATDACGNQSTCSQTVTVTDNNQAPVFTSCPGNQTQTALAGNCSLSNIVLPDPLFTDNCAVTRLTWTMSGATTGTSAATGINYVSGQTFNVGITTVTYLAFDAAGNQSLPCTFDVTIKDLNKPVFTVGCPVNVTTNADPGLCTAAITVPVPAVTDPCNEGYTLTNSFNNTNNASGSYPVGVTNFE